MGAGIEGLRIAPKLNKNVRKEKAMNITNYNGTEIRKDKDGYICLTDMWRACGSPTGKRTVDFQELETTKAVIEFMQNSKSAIKALLKSKRGAKTGGTWATPELSIAYAKYLSPEFHAWTLGVVKERIEENANPELAVSRGIERAKATYRKQGKSEGWIEQRLNGSIPVRKYMASEFVHRGATQYIAPATNAIYDNILGAPAKAAKAKRNLPESASLRDNLTRTELAAVMLAESLTVDGVQQHKCYGERCLSAAEFYGKKVGAAIGAKQLTAGA